MGEPSKKELRDIFQRAYLARSEQGDPEATFVSDCSDAGYRALYNAGKADAEARIRAEERERVLGILRRRFRLHDAGLSYGIFASELERELCAIEEARKA